MQLMFGEIRDALADLYRQDDRPWLVGFSGGKDSTMVASLVVDAVLAQPVEARKKPVTILCTDASTPSCSRSRFGMRRQRFNRRWTRMNADTGYIGCHSEFVEESLALMT